MRVLDKGWISDLRYIAGAYVGLTLATVAAVLVAR